MDIEVKIQKAFLQKKDNKKKEHINYLTNLLRELNPESTDVESRDKIQYTDAYISEIKKKLSDYILNYQHKGNEDIEILIQEVRDKLNSIEQAKAKALAYIKEEKQRKEIQGQEQEIQLQQLFISIQSKLKDYGYNITEERDFPLIISRINEDNKKLKGLVFGRIFNRKK